MKKWLVSIWIVLYSLSGMGMHIMRHACCLPPSNPYALSSAENSSQIASCKICQEEAHTTSTSSSSTSSSCPIDEDLSSGIPAQSQCPMAFDTCDQVTVQASEINPHTVQKEALQAFTFEPWVMLIAWVYPPSLSTYTTAFSKVEQKTSSLSCPLFIRICNFRI